jgi:hypothetical protein
MMIQPHDADNGETHDVGGEIRHAVGQLMTEVVEVRRGGDREDEQGSGDGEDAVAEGFEPCLAHVALLGGIA